MYDDALLQLKAAQERKNQLAAENEKLKQQIDVMNKEMAAAKTELEALRQVDASHAERTFFLRSHYMSWQAFTQLNPETGDRWRLFLESAFLLSPADRVPLINRDWPATTPPATRPATMPASAPATAAPESTQPTTQPAPGPSTAPAASQPDAPAAAAESRPSAATQPSSTAPAISPSPAVQEK